MHTRTRNLFISVLVALGFTFLLTVFAHAQVAPEPAPAPAAAGPDEQAAPSATPDEASDDSADDSLRRLDTATPAPTAAVTTGTAPADAHDSDETRVETRRHRRHSADGPPFGNHTVAAGSTVRELISFLGNSVLHGESEQGVVSILGNTTVTGKSGGEAVAVLGDVVIDGEVSDQVVAVFGNVTLGPKAVVRGDVVVIGGSLERDPAAVVDGNVQDVNLFFHASDFNGFKTWFHECALWGRPLAFHSDLGWAWTLAISAFALYVLLALLFPRAFDKCAETLERRPGSSLLSVLLTVLITPVLIVVLVATGIGIILLPFVIIGLIVGSVFGKAVMHAWLGRRITKYLPEGPMRHAAMATLIGSVLLLLLYTVPFLGFFLWKVLDVIGLGVVVYALILVMRGNRPAPAPTPVVPPTPVPPTPSAATPDGVPSATAMPADPAAAGFAGAAAGPAAAAVPPPVIPVTALPRAGFWIRLLASLLDVVVVGVVVGITNTGSWFLLLFAAYCVALWALKGTTIGGIVCGLKVVRLDERKVDWTVAIVRGLSGFLSLAVAGLGFVWVAFDKDRQSWHDKIAGTVVVVVPKGVSLI